MIQLEAELARKSAKLKVVRKEKANLEASTEAEVVAAYNVGVAEAMRDYDAQVDVLGPRLFERGCKAVLRKMGIPEDNPIYQDLPKLKDQVAKQSPAPAAVLP